jgi:NAD(P)-dependent dehydrogenase (short-subunit alcohol dehydrogenase family)
MLTAVHAARLAEEGILVVLAAPGFTRPAVTNGQGAKDPSSGAKTLFARLLGQIGLNYTVQS